MANRVYNTTNQTGVINDSLKYWELLIKRLGTDKGLSLLRRSVVTLYYAPTKNGFLILNNDIIKELSLDDKFDGKLVRLDGDLNLGGYILAMLPKKYTNVVKQTKKSDIKKALYDICNKATLYYKDFEYIPKGDRKVKSLPEGIVLYIAYWLIMDEVEASLEGKDYTNKELEETIKKVNGFVKEQLNINLSKFVSFWDDRYDICNTSGDERDMYSLRKILDYGSFVNVKNIEKGLKDSKITSYKKINSLVRDNFKV